jgi:UDP:flavonoid glycosyltransferase YjiC (YdhE family)
MSYGKPMILIPTPSHTEQISNAKQASDLGVAKVIQQENVTREKLLEKVNLMMTSDIRDRLAHVQRDVSGYDGLENAAKIIAGIAERKASVLS